MLTRGEKDPGGGGGGGGDCTQKCITTQALCKPRKETRGRGPEQGALQAGVGAGGEHLVQLRL